jgi:hypothetical protein
MGKGTEWAHHEVVMKTFQIPLSKRQLTKICNIRQPALGP